VKAIGWSADDMVLPLNSDSLGQLSLP